MARRRAKTPRSASRSRSSPDVDCVTDRGWSETATPGSERSVGFGRRPVARFRCLRHSRNGGISESTTITATIGSRYLSMFSEPISFPRKKPSRRDADRPDRRADHVRGGERGLRHAARTRQHRHDRPHERNEAGEDDRRRAPPFEELVGLLEILRLEDLRVGPEQLGCRTAGRSSSRSARRRRPRRTTSDEHDREVEMRIVAAGLRSRRRTRPISRPRPRRPTPVPRFADVPSSQSSPSRRSWSSSASCFGLRIRRRSGRRCGGVAIRGTAGSARATTISEDDREAGTCRCSGIVEPST